MGLPATGGAVCDGAIYIYIYIYGRRCGCRELRGASKGVKVIYYNILGGVRDGAVGAAVAVAN
jgi:hypothetical protein